MPEEGGVPLIFGVPPACQPNREATAEPGRGGRRSGVECSGAAAADWRDALVVAASSI